MILEIIILLLGIPAGYLVSYLARDELIIGREWFRGLVIAGIILGIGSGLFGYSAWAWTFCFIAVVSFVSYLKSFDKKWTKKRV